MKIWLCTDGDYSDYRVEAVFTDEAKARKAAEVMGWGVDERDADEHDPAAWPEGKTPWRVMAFPLRKGRDAYYATPSSTPAALEPTWHVANVSGQPTGEPYADAVVWATGKSDAEGLCALQVLEMRRLLKLSVAHEGGGPT